MNENNTSTSVSATDEPFASGPFPYTTAYGPSADPSASTSGALIVHPEATSGEAAAADADSSTGGGVEQDVARHYMDTVIAGMNLYFGSFEGNTDSLKRCTNAKVGTSDAKPPEGTEEFSMAWLGVAAAIVDVILEVSAPSPSDSEETEPLDITIKDARMYFAAGLNSVVSVVTVVGSSAYYRRHSFTRFSQTSELEAVSKRVMEEWVCQGKLPASLQSLYVSDDDKVRSVADLEQLLRADTEVWVTSFFPLYRMLSQNSGYRLRLVWEKDTLQHLSVDELGYHIYTLCSLENLLVNSDGNPRGVVVPHAWLEELLGWFEKAKQTEDTDDTAVLPQPPGPIDTFHCVEVVPGAPGRHWLSPAAKAAAEVIPERLFDFLTLLFGSGPRYSTYGKFTLRNRFLSSLKPLPLMVEVKFQWYSSATLDGINEERSVTVYVSDAVHRTDLAEVFRLAFDLAYEESGMMNPMELARWSASVNGTGMVRAKAKYVQGCRLKTPVNVERPSEVYIDTLLKKMLAQLKEEDPMSWEEETQNMRKESIAIELEMVNPELSTERCGVCGLTNVGNTCYMNSALQALSNLTKFRHRLLSLPVSRFSEATITSAYVQVMTELWSGQRHCAETRALKDAIGEKVRRFADYQQQDANEFIEVLLDRVHEEINPVSGRRYRERLDSDKAMPILELSEVFWENFLENNRSFIPQLFFYQTKTLFQCLTCQESSIVFDNNVTLSLNMREPVSKRNMTVTVIVQLLTPTPAAQASDTALPDCPTPYDARSFVRVHLQVSVVEPDGGDILPSDVEAAVRRALRKSASLAALQQSAFRAQQDLLDDAPAPVMPPIDYTVALLEVPDYGRAYACASTYTPVSSAPTHVTGPASTASSAKPQYRVWYFLKDRTEYVATSYGALAFTEDLSPPPVAAPGAEANEEANKEGDSAATTSASGPLSAHIIARGKELAQQLLLPRPEDHQLSDAAEAQSSDHLYHTDASGTVAKDPAQLHLRVMHRASRSRPLFDIAASAKDAGDSWVEKFRHDQLFAYTSKRGSVEGEDPALPLCVFLQYDGNSFEPAPMKELGTTTSSYGWSSSPSPDAADEEDSEDDGCTLHDCIVQSMQPDTLTGSDSWYCPTCKEFRDTRVQRSMFRLPPCLIVSFKRFKMNSSYADKNNTLVKFPTSLDYASYLDPEADHTQSTRYRLRSVVYHSGSLGFGHYTACAFNDTMQKWVYYNDSSATVEEIVTPRQDGAYILCYERVEVAPSVEF